MALLAIFLAALAALPQAASTSSNPAVPRGFQVMAELQREVSSKKAKVGDTVLLTCTDEIASETNTVYLPAGAKLTATVVAAQPHKGSDPGQLALHLTAADWKGGHAELNAIVTTLAALPATRETPPDTAGMLQDRMSSPAVGTGTNMPSIESDRTMPTIGTVSHPADTSVHNPGQGVTRVRDASAGEKSLADLDKKNDAAVRGALPKSWEIKRLDDAKLGTAIVASGGDVNLPKGARLIFTVQ